MSATMSKSTVVGEVDIMTDSYINNAAVRFAKRSGASVQEFLSVAWLATHQMKDPTTPRVRHLAYRRMLDTFLCEMNRSSKRTVYTENHVRIKYKVSFVPCTFGECNESAVGDTDTVPEQVLPRGTEEDLDPDTVIETMQLAKKCLRREVHFQVLKLWFEGYMNCEIAQLLNVSQASISQLRREVIQALQEARAQ